MRVSAAALAAARPFLRKQESILAARGSER